MTAPLIVALFSGWAWRRLAKADVPVAGGSTAHAVLALPLTIGAGHLAAYALTRGRPGAGGRDACRRAAGVVASGGKNGVPA